MPSRPEPRRRPQQDRRGRLREDTVVDLTALVEDLAPPRRKKEAPPATAASHRTQARKVSTRAPRPPKSRRRKAARRPIADESALFDASRCDFATLVKILDDTLKQD
jgi:hypothetical protein